MPGPGADAREEAAGAPDPLCRWLLERALRDAGVADLVEGAGRGLAAAGVPLCRLSVAVVVLDPSFGGLGAVWDADDAGPVRCRRSPRGAFATPEFRDAPFFAMGRDQVPFRRFRLDREGDGDGSAVLERLRREGVTDYVACYHSYGRAGRALWDGLPPGMEGVCASFATRRAGGFARAEVERLEALSLPLAAAVKTATGDELARELLSAYLGRDAGERVLRGQVERGDSRAIECALWYSDLRGSTALAEGLPLEDYLATLNDYFDRAAGAVLDHGGEVLKHVGDAVLAIFPFAGGPARPPAEACEAALLAAGDALARARAGNAARAAAGRPPAEFGIALHAGRVLYGNVGTARRLDFTVVGPAVNEAARLEGLCKTLGAPVLASARFRELCGPRARLVPLGRHPAAGVPGGLEAFAPDDLAAARPRVGSAA